MGTTLLLFSAVVPALFCLWYLCSRDANPEPARVVIKTFLLGALVTIPIIPVAYALEALGKDAMGMWPRALVGGFLGASIPEELFKFLVIRLWVWRQKEFDEPMDGIVYSAAASLGFAALENVLYVEQGGFGVATLRALTAVPGHALSGVIMGYFAGRAKFAPEADRNGLLLKGLLAAAALHGTYDTFLLTGSIFAGLAVPVLAYQFWLARKLIVEMHAEQTVWMEAFRMPKPTDSGPQQRTFWAVTKLVLGAIGASLGVLLLLLCALTARAEEIDQTATAGLLLAAVLAAIATGACGMLFRSGLRGPFVDRASPELSA
jgi:RsiW-degrading membrane proteinase PrsW (M82 family)